MSPDERLTRDYRAAFLRYLPRRDEAALTTGYELGRGAVADGVSILELVTVHHDVVADVLRDTPAASQPDVAGAAAELLLEVLATYDMAHRTARDLSGQDDTPTG